MSTGELRAEQRGSRKDRAKEVWKGRPDDISQWGIPDLGLVNCLKLVFGVSNPDRCSAIKICHLVVFITLAEQHPHTLNLSHIKKKDHSVDKKLFSLSKYQILLTHQKMSSPTVHSERRQGSRTEQSRTSFLGHHIDHNLPWWIFIFSAIHQEQESVDLSVSNRCNKTQFPGHPIRADLAKWRECWLTVEWRQPSHSRLAEVC